MTKNIIVESPSTTQPHSTTNPDPTRAISTEPSYTTPWAMLRMSRMAA